jgi:hypothetical protein
VTAPVFDLREQIFEHGDVPRSRYEGAGLLVRVGQPQHAPDSARLADGRDGLDVEPPLEERLGRQRGEDATTRPDSQHSINEVLRRLARIGVELDAIVHPPDQDLLRVERDSKFEWPGRGGTDDALDGESGMGSMTCGVLDDVQSKRRFH